MENLDYKVLLDELLKLLSEGVYIVDEDGIGIAYNQAMADIEKISVDDVVGKEYSKAFPGVPPTESTMFRALKKGEATSSQEQTYLNLYGKEVTTINRTTPVKIDGKDIDLSYKEFELLTYFLENKDIALSREKILNAVWNYDYFGDARTIDTHVKKLRAKMGEKGAYIKTIWGMGYKYSPTME